MVGLLKSVAYGGHVIHCYKKGSSTRNNNAWVSPFSALAQYSPAYRGAFTGFSISISKARRLYCHKSRRLRRNLRNPLIINGH